MFLEEKYLSNGEHEVKTSKYFDVFYLMFSIWQINFLQKRNKTFFTFIPHVLHLTNGFSAKKKKKKKKKKIDAFTSCSPFDKWIFCNKPEHFWRFYLMFSIWQLIFCKKKKKKQFRRFYLMFFIWQMNFLQKKKQQNIFDVFNSCSPFDKWIFCKKQQHFWRFYLMFSIWQMNFLKKKRKKTFLTFLPHILHLTNRFFAKKTFLTFLPHVLHLTIGFSANKKPKHFWRFYLMFSIWQRDFLQKKHKHFLFFYLMFSIWQLNFLQKNKSFLTLFTSCS